MNAHTKMTANARTLVVTAIVAICIFYLIISKYRTSCNDVLSEGNDIHVRLIEIDDTEYVLRDFTKLQAVKAINEPKTRWDDPALIQLIRQELLDPSRLHVPKQSFPLYKTPQADAVDEILQGQVGNQSMV